jgi:hypothetical protein
MGAPRKKPAAGTKFCTRYYNRRAKKWMVAAEYGYKAWPFGGGKKVS